MNNGCPDGKLCSPSSTQEPMKRQTRPWSCCSSVQRYMRSCGWGTNSSSGPHALPAVVAAQLPRDHVVVEAERQRLIEPRRVPGMDDRHEHLHPPEQVARHQVGRADEVDRVGDRSRHTGALGPVGDHVAVRESIDPAVLQEPAEHAADADVLRQTRHAGAQTADTAHEHVDLRSGLARRVEGVDDRPRRRSRCTST